MTYYSYYGIFSINMAKKIVTNLRIDENDWLQIKAEAGEMGMSINEYINYIIRKISVRIELALDKDIPQKEKYSIWNLAGLAKIPGKTMKMSDEDRIIYAK